MNKQAVLILLWTGLKIVLDVVMFVYLVFRFRKG